MADESDKLRLAVEQLHQALEATHGLTPQSRELLERTLGEVRGVLAQPSAEEAPTSASPPDPLRAQLAEAAAEFEGSHPTLAGTVRSVIDALAQMGI